MIGGYGVTNLLEHGGLAGARRGYDQATSAFADWRHQIDDACFNNIRIGLEIKFIKWINCGEVLET